jgi:hypothetical protein
VFKSEPRSLFSPESQSHSVSGLYTQTPNRKKNSFETGNTHQNYILQVLETIFSLSNRQLFSPHMKLKDFQIKFSFHCSPQSLLKARFVLVPHIHASIIKRLYTTPSTSTFPVKTPFPRNDASCSSQATPVTEVVSSHPTRPPPPQHKGANPRVWVGM